MVGVPKTTARGTGRPVAVEQRGSRARAVLAAEEERGRQEGRAEAEAVRAAEERDHIAVRLPRVHGARRRALEQRDELVGEALPHTRADEHAAPPTAAGRRSSSESATCPPSARMTEMAYTESTR